jgi:hypothetical protein
LGRLGGAGYFSLRRHYPVQVIGYYLSLFCNVSTSSHFDKLNVTKKAPRKFKRLKELVKHKGMGVLDIFLNTVTKQIPVTYN